jgi:hypothetical protein
MAKTIAADLPESLLGKRRIVEGDGPALTVIKTDRGRLYLRPEDC